MEALNKHEQVDTSPSLVEFKTEITLNQQTSFYFNPEIYFPCKLCRHTFSTVDSLFKHKRRKHSVAELKNIKVIIFEERFVKDELNSDSATVLSRNGDSCEKIKTEVQQGPNSGVEPLCKDQDKNFHQVTNENSLDKHLRSTVKFKETVSGTSSIRNLDPIVNSEPNTNSNLTESPPFFLLERMTEKEIQDAKNNLKNPQSRKRASGFNSDIDVESKRANVFKQEMQYNTIQKQEMPNLNKNPFLSSSPEKSNPESDNTEFIILDIISKGDGLREITFSTSNELTTDEYQHPLEEPKMDSTPKPEQEELSPPESEEIAEEVSMAEDEDIEPVLVAEYSTPKPEQDAISSRDEISEEMSVTEDAEIVTDTGLEHPLEVPELEQMPKPEQKMSRESEPEEIPEDTSIGAEPMSDPERDPLIVGSEEERETETSALVTLAIEKSPQKSSPIVRELLRSNSKKSKKAKTKSQRKQQHDSDEDQEEKDDAVRFNNTRSYREYCMKFDRIFYIPRGIKKSQDLTQSSDEGNDDADESFTNCVAETEPNKSPTKNTTVEIEAPPRRYNTRGCNKTRKSYADSEELKCSKSSQVFSTQNELEDHRKLQCNEPALSEGLKSKTTAVAVDSDTDKEWSGNSVENSDAEDKAGEEDNEAVVPKTRRNESRSKLKSKTRSTSKSKTNLSKSVVYSENSSTCPNESAEGPSTTSFKEWLREYKKDFPESLVLLDPDPLLEPEPEPGHNHDQRQGQDVPPAGTGTETETVLFPLKCKLCNKKLQSEGLTKNHVMICWRYNKNSHSYCFKCDKTFDCKNGLKNHNLLKHPEPGQDILNKIPSHKCPTCGKVVVGGKTALELHVATHEKPENRERNFVCEICGASFYNTMCLYPHMKSHSEERPFKCTQCPATFKHKPSLTLHEECKHSGITHSCTVCGKKYSAASSLRKHTSAYHYGQNTFECLLGSEKCPLKFLTREHMISHCRKEHPEILSSSKIPCTLCSKTFWTNSLLKVHMVKHTGVRPFKCTHEGCERKFTLKDHLVEHMRTHTGEKPFQCDGCGSTFWKKFSFVKHCKMSCPNKDTAAERNKFPCHLCLRKFPGSWELKRHVKLHEEGKVSADGSVRGGAKGKVKGRGKGRGEKGLECEGCDFKCGTKKALKEHEKIHDESEDDDDDIEEENENNGEETESTASD